MSSSKILEQGIQAAINGHYDEAKRLLKMALKLEDLSLQERIAALLWLAECESDPQDKIDWYNQILVLDPTNQDALLRVTFFKSASHLPSEESSYSPTPQGYPPDYIPANAGMQPGSVVETDDNVGKQDVPIANAENEQVYFTAFYPRQASARREYGFYVYAHLENALLLADIENFVDFLGGRVPKPAQASESASLQEGALLTAMIHCDKLKFNQMGAMQVWKAPFVRFDFRFSADEALIDEILEGRVAILLGMIEIASIDFKISVGAASPLAAANALPDKPTLTLDASPSMPPYQKIFVSYSRKDSIVAEQYRAAQTMLGNTIFMDVHNIRAGEDWEEALKRFISEADVFQLFWSEHSASSDHVRFEWDYALKQRCPDTLCRQFIRPTYWQKPMPAVPDELNHLHFAFVEVQNS